MKKDNFAKKTKPKLTFSWMNPKLEIRDTVNHGKGVFSKKETRKDELLAILGGYVLALKEESKLPNSYRDTGIQIAEDFVLSSKYCKEDTDYFNHSCDPNAGFNGQIFLVAMRNINKNEEITFDYAMAICKTKNARSYKFKCHCGSKKCRKFVTNNDWNLPRLQKKYKGFFQPYLQKIIDANKK